MMPFLQNIAMFFAGAFIATGNPDFGVFTAVATMATIIVYYNQRG